MTHFGFTKLVVADLEASAAFYRDVFGVTEQYRVHADIAGREIDEILFEATAPGGSTFVLLRFVDTAAPASGEVIIGFVTDDLDGVFARATEAGGSVHEAIHDSPDHGVRVGFLADPEGHLIEVVQPL
ncbi:MAG: hypothetical protein AMXMBFR46_08540 [Acidimicrobiia bacterium]